MTEDFKDIFDGYENNPAIAHALIGWQKQEIESLTVNMNAFGLAAKRLAEEKEALEKEVERLQMILDSYALQYGTVMDQHLVIEKARAEVAREIFEDFTKHKVCTNEEDFRVLAELKKKYTEDTK